MNQVKDFLEYIFNSVKIWVIVQPWEQGIRVRGGKNTKKLYPGMHFKIPYYDSVYVQETRLRVVSLTIQTLTTKDFKSITANNSLGFSIFDIEKLYNTLYHPEGTVSHLAMSEFSSFVFNHNLEDMTPEDIEKYVLEKLNSNDFGIKFEYFKTMSFAAIRAYRLIQDGQSWVDNSLKMDEKK